MLVERQIDDELLQPAILVLHLPQAAELAHAKVGVLLLPEVVSRRAHAELPAVVRHRRPTLGLALGVGNLLFGILRALHRILLTDTEDHEADLL